MKNILVLCTGNSCRSQIAEGYLKQYLNEIILKQLKTFLKNTWEWTLIELVFGDIQEPWLQRIYLGHQKLIHGEV